MKARTKRPSSQTRLAVYTAKRDFTKTPEPQDKASVLGHRFVVQHHWARRDHYDFRLEVEGVMASWAVTRGPSLNPADKRLAVRTEDHPISYNDFEGVIPQGAYGGGTVMIWDRGLWEPISEDVPQALSDGSLKFRLYGERMTGAWALVRMKPEGKRENWLLIKEKDEAADREKPFLERFETSVATGRTKEEIEAGAPIRVQTEKAVQTSQFTTPPKFTPPLLCETRDVVPVGSDWIYEIKYDGYRLQAACHGDAVHLYTREGLDWTHRFFTIAQSLQKLYLPPCLIDGEAVVFDARGISDFAKLVAALEAGKPTAFVAFDLIDLEGQDISAWPLLKRKAELAKLLSKRDEAVVRVAPWMEGDGQSLFKDMIAGGAEGLICKKKQSPYRSGRSGSWVKVKTAKREDVVVIGFSPSDKRAFSSLLAAISDNEGGLRYVGRFGTGFSVAQMTDIAKRLDDIKRKTPPSNVSGLDKAPRGAKWVDPVMRAEIEMAGWTGEGQIRQGRFLGWREDRIASKEKPTSKKPPASRRAKTKESSDEALSRISHADRVIYPETGTTKGDVAHYYLTVAERVLPHLKDRPVSFVRAPEGLAHETFFQRHALPGMKRGIARIPDPRQEHSDYVEIVSVDGLVTAAQFSVIELHGWGAKAPKMNAPDRMIFDLDPDDAVLFSQVRDAAFLMRDLLKTVDLISFPMLTGGKGIHVVVPLDASQDWDIVGDFSAGVARGLTKSDPASFIAVASKVKRRGKIFIDWLRNRPTATAIIPWSLRARAQPTVALPLTWDRLKTVKTPACSLYTDVLNSDDTSSTWYEQRQAIPDGALRFLRKSF